MCEKEWAVAAQCELLRGKQHGQRDLLLRSQSIDDGSSRPAGGLVVYSFTFKRVVCAWIVTGIVTYQRTHLKVIEVLVPPEV